MVGIIISIGCNICHEEQIKRAKEVLSEYFPGMLFSKTIMEPDYRDGKRTYANCIAKGETSLELSALNTLLKNIEQLLGRTPGDTDIMMDIDLMQYGEEKHHLRDWQQTHVQKLITSIADNILKTSLTILVAIFFLFSHVFFCNAEKTDNELLTQALEYYQGGKYQEALLNFQKLQKHYNLTPRYKAYIGFSYYKIGEWESAAKELSPVLPSLSSFSPKEQAVYQYACAESYFNLSQYPECLKIYQETLQLVEGLDKADVLFHIAFARYLQGDDNAEILSLFQQANDLYMQFTKPDDELHTARMKQTEKMLRYFRKNS